MQVLATPPLDKQKRSLSYNDLKRKRLMRSAKSQKNLPSRQEHSTVKKGMSQAKNILSSIPRDEHVIQDCIQELKGVLGTLRSRSSKKRIISVRQSMTERPSARQSVELDQSKGAAMWSKVQQAGQTKQLIKHLLNKNKSQRKLVKFNEIRDKFKKQKERSLSHDKSLVKAIPSPVKDLKEKTVVNVKRRPVVQDLHVRQTQPIIIKVQSLQLQQQLDRLQHCPKEQIDKLLASELGKQNEQSNIATLNIPDISSINCNNNDRFNESQLKLLQTAQSTSTQPIQGSFLQLLNQNLNGQKCLRGKQARRRGQLQRVKRIFPCGFFDN